MSPLVLCSLFAFLILVEAKAQSSSNDKANGCGMEQLGVLGSIGGVVDEKSQIGKEQRVAMEMAVLDFNNHLSKYCSSELVLHLNDSHGSSVGAALAAIELAKEKQMHAILGALTLQEAAFIWKHGKPIAKDIAIISIISPVATKPLPHRQPKLFIQMGNSDIIAHMQCIAAIVGHFGWRKLIAIYESSNSFSDDSGLITYLSDSLRSIDSVVEHHVGFPPVVSVSEPGKFIERELKKLRGKNEKVFTVMQSSLDFAMILFDKAKKMGMMGKGFVWIVSDDIASLLDSVDPSVIGNMQGVIGFKTDYAENTKSFRQFKLRFSRDYRSKYGEEGYNISPSIYALRAYDATWAAVKAISEIPQGKMNSNVLVNHILSSKFEGLSGEISFRNYDQALPGTPIFRIINVIGKSYREVATWSPEFGFSAEEIVGHDQHGTGMKMNGNGIKRRDYLGSIYWPGGEQTIPKGWTLGIDDIEKPLRVGVPAMGAFHQFVNVTFDQDRNATSFSGFSIQVFEAAVKELPYHLPLELVPYYGTYDELLVEVSKKVNRTLDAAVGDVGIVTDRYEIVAFSQPYIESGLVVVVTEKEDVKKARFIVLRAFKIEMWILMAGMTLSTGIVIWLTEHVSGNLAFQGSFPTNIGSMLWFSVTVLSFAQRESIKSNLSRLVLTAWLFVVLVVSACLTANLSSMMTVPRLQPSAVSVDYLRSTNAPVGCNGNSFFERYLINNLRFKPENVKKFNSIDAYPRAFETGEIRAAFFASPHAKFFIAKYCRGYTAIGPSFKLGGLGFAFPKGSSLAIDISEAILKITQSGKINELEEEILSASNCSSSKRNVDDDPIGLVPFYGLFLVSGTISTVVFSVTLARLLKMHLSLHGLVVNTRVGRWASLVLIKCFSRFGLRLFREATIQTPNKQKMNKPRDEIDQNLEAV